MLVIINGTVLVFLTQVTEIMPDSKEKVEKPVHNEHMNRFIVREFSWWLGKPYGYHCVENKG